MIRIVYFYKNISMRKSNHLIIPVVLGVLFLIATGCNKEEEAIKPSITTVEITDITSYSATCGGNIASDGGTPVTSRGMVWSTLADPTIETNTGFTIDGTGTGSFISNLTDLIPDTTYYSRAYATNNIGTDYGIQRTFKTLDGVALLTTDYVSDITLTTAKCGSNITSDGGAPVISRGVVWSTVENPTIESNNGITTDGADTGSFTSMLAVLTPNTVYYTRAYAINNVGTRYGNEIIVKTRTGTITDNDGNMYYTVTIGSQVWMAENLKTTKYNDGTDIPNVTDVNQWANLYTPAYCWYNNDIGYKETYGALYNFYTVNTGKLCPAGWHIPTDAEWSTLTDYLGESVAGSKLKETGTTHWYKPNTGATNETGFTALPGGYRHHDGNFYAIDYLGQWWSSTEYITTYAYGRSMYTLNSDVYRYYNSKEMGSYVRCVKD
jgi:uncharacterized protein (TIGR02145 family)